VLAASAVETTPAVVQGQPVLLRTRVAGVEVELPATAMTDGRLGQPVQLRSPLSQAVITAQVTAPREATLTIH
jgi:flagella basal body P-ring formation protein FlgA